MSNIYLGRINPPPTKEMTEQPLRRALTGSCHCRSVQYIIHLTLPHPHDATLPLPPPRGYQHFYRCNCTICHKMGHFHVRPVSPTHDFLLLSPTSTVNNNDDDDKNNDKQQDPLSELGDYTCYAGNLHFYFCKTCGVRCFIFAGDLELVEVNLNELNLSVNKLSSPTTADTDNSNSNSNDNSSNSTRIKAWRPRLGGGHPEMGHYLSINGHTIDAEQGFDMRQLTEENQVRYCDCYSPEEDEVPMRYGKPQLHGSY